MAAEAVPAVEVAAVAEAVVVAVVAEAAVGSTR
jgi:hypothetical protein